MLELLQPAFPEPVSGSVLAMLTLVCIVAGMVRGFSGFGSAMVMAPIYSAVFGPTVAVPVVLVTEMLISFPLIASARKSALMDVVKQMLLAAAVGALGGLALVVFMPADVLASVVALTVLGFVALMVAQDRWQPVRKPATNRQRYLAGGASG
ncbi:MAG: sulfite exporter TauE/SafE family protein, partial [Alteromonadaceae bacterium]|nr:sulfite exporter TauE/SafE family protein [Alteromonadaceae bacterium]